MNKFLSILAFDPYETGIYKLEIASFFEAGPEFCFFSVVMSELHLLLLLVDYGLLFIDTVQDSMHAPSSAVQSCMSFFNRVPKNAVRVGKSKIQKTRTKKSNAVAHQQKRIS